MKRIGVLGGGQLGRMLALAGHPLGQEFVFIEPAEDACAAHLGDHLVSDYDDLETLDTLVEQVSVATFDFENVPTASAQHLAEKIPFHPSPLALASGQDRLVEKQLLRSLDIPTPDFCPVSSRVELLEAVDQLGLPAVLKTRRMGYDGKGQMVLRQSEDLERAWQKLGDHDLILEAFVPFDCEGSIIAVRGQGDNTRYWPLTRNHHGNGMLAVSMAPYFSQAMQEKAEDLIGRLLQHFDYVGVLTLELFVVGDELLANEIAPRVHNSGHWTIDGAVASQFENHLRAITGLPLGDTDATGHALMFNWIGALPDQEQCLRVPGLHWHDYNKAPREGRKVGHATLVADDMQQLQDRAIQVAAIAGGDFPDQIEGFFSDRCCKD